jgi:PAS domain S-box-containing protein
MSVNKSILELLKAHSKNENSFNELKNLVENLISQRDLLESAVRNDYDSILITELNLEKPGPKIVYVNDGFTRMTGYSREEAIGNTPRMLQGEKTDRAVLDKLKTRLMEGQSFFGHTVNYRKDGSEFINQWDIHPLTNAKGEITHWVSYQHDITERKRSEKRMIDTEIEFDQLSEETKRIAIDLDEQGNILSTNKAFRDMIGYDAQELKPKKIWDLLEEQEIETMKHRFDKFKPGDFNDRTYNMEMVNASGRKMEVAIQSKLMNNSGQTIVRFFIENKSLQKRIMQMLAGKDVLEEMLSQSKDYSYKLVEDAGGGYKFEYLSENFSRITGITANESKLLPLTDLIHDDDQEKVIAHLQKVMSGKSNTEVFRIKTKTGDFKEVIDYAKPVMDDNGTIVVAIKGSTSTEISSEKKIS